MLYKMCTISANQVGIVLCSWYPKQVLQQRYQYHDVISTRQSCCCGAPSSSWKLQMSLQERLIVHCKKLKTLIIQTYIYIFNESMIDIFNERYDRYEEKQRCFLNSYFFLSHIMALDMRQKLQKLWVFLLLTGLELERD